MKFSCVFVLCLLGVLSTASAFQTCTASGDPHVKTFDGLYHDLQGNGTFQMVQNKLFNVQARYLNCTATSLVTCIYSVTVQYAPLGADGDSFIVSWGSWPGEAAQLAKFQYNYAGSTSGTTVSVPLSGLTALVNTVDTNGVYTYPLFDPKNVVSRRPLPSFYVLVSPGNVLKLGSNTAGLNVGETSVLVQPQVIFSLRSLTILIPDDTNRFATPVQTVTDSSTILTNGLCGRFDYSGSNEFTNNGALTSTFNTAKNFRYNSPAYPVNAWGASFAVSTDPTAIPPLLSGNVYDMNGNIHLQSTMEIQATVPTVPTDSQQATLNVVTFENGVSQMAAATTFCNQQAAGKTYDSVIIENCVYDAAFVGDLSTAASNGQTYEVAAAASNTVIASSSGSSSSNDTAVIVGVTIGCVAAVAIIVGIVLYFRLQRVKEDYSRALILRNQSTAGGPNPSGSSADIEFHHADNL